MAVREKTLDEKKALLEEREKKVRQALARLQKEKARLSQEERKARNGELIAAGLFFLDYVYRVMDEEWRENMYQETAWFFEYDKRNLERIRSALDRLIAENDWGEARRREKPRKVQQEVLPG